MRNGRGGGGGEEEWFSSTFLTGTLICMMLKEFVLIS